MYVWALGLWLDLQGLGFRAFYSASYLGYLAPCLIPFVPLYIKLGALKRGPGRRFSVGFGCLGC